MFITTRFGVPEARETASVVDSESAPAQEDIGNYIKNKRRIHEYLSQFIKDKRNKGIFVFSIIPGTVDTPANRELITVGTPEISASKIKEREEGRERDTTIVGRVIAKMTATRKKFNPETQRYDIEIENGEVVEISNAVVEFELSQTNRTILVGDVPYVSPDEGPIHRVASEPHFRADEVVKEFPLWHMKNWEQDRKISSASETFVEKVKRFYGEDIDSLTFGDLVRGMESLQQDFETNDSTIHITQSELWKRSRGESGASPLYVQ